MTEEILVNYTPMETRVAVVENGVVQEFYIEREIQRGRVGGIFKGRVVRVLPGMQAAFVDIGLERAAFIHASDIWREPRQNSSELPSSSAELFKQTDDETEQHDEDFIVLPIKKSGESIGGGFRHNAPVASTATNIPNIQDLVKEGQELAVQVVKDQIGTKGARLTTHLSIPSRYLVFMPDADHIGISQRIEDEVERERLRQIIGNYVEEMLPESMLESVGIIARTVADGVDEKAIKADLEFLFKLWQSLVKKMQNATAVSTIHRDLPLYLRAIRDLVRPNVERLRIDSKSTHEKILGFVREFMPSVERQVEHYSGERPIFDLYGVEDELKKSLEQQVQLKSGGYLIVDQTEAMTTVDVNTGGYVGHRNLEETIYKTNLEAAHAIARQLRLRNLGGIIIIDFIDMQEEEHKRQVLRALEKMLERDHAKTKITQVSELGLVEMTRKRTRASLQRLLCEPCPVCQGRGFIKTAETTVYEIYREILREATAYQSETLLVIAAQAVIDRLLDEESANVADLEDYTGSTLKFQVEALYTQEQFDVVLL